MEFGPVTYLLGYVAGVVSTLSPCVLPLLPILVATATTRHRYGALALAAGLTLSFAAIGVFVATIGVAIGLDTNVLRAGAAVLLIVFGALMLSRRLQDALRAMVSSFGASGQGALAMISGRGWAGQFAVGLVLGIVWSPCVGPTLGAASTLAAQGSRLPQVALLMLLFGLGAGTPLVLVGNMSRELLSRWRERLLMAGHRGQWVLGAVFIAIGLAIVSGADKQFETWAVEHSPDWLTRFTTRF